MDKYGQIWTTWTNTLRIRDSLCPYFTSPYYDVNQSVYVLEWVRDVEQQRVRDVVSNGGF